MRRRARLRTLLGLVVAAQILTGGLAGAQSSESMDFEVRSGRSITVGTLVGDGMSLRETDLYSGISSAISEYIGETETDVIEVSRVPTHEAVQNGLEIDEGAIRIEVLAYDLTCALCAEGDGPGSASEDPVVIPVSDRPTVTDPVTSWVMVIEGIDTGVTSAWAKLVYTVRTDDAVAAAYSYTFTYRIRAA